MRSSRNGFSKRLFLSFLVGSALIIRLTFFPAQTHTTSEAASSSFQPTAPFYATFFYVWSQNPDTSDPATGAPQTWSYWSDNAHTPPQNWFSNYLPDPNPSLFEPAHELYSSVNDKILYWQLSKLAEAKQEVALTSWWGKGHKTDNAFRYIVTDIMNRSDNPYPNLRWAVYYEKEGDNSQGLPNDPRVSEIVSDLDYIYKNYASQPAYLRVNDKPVVFVYGDANDGAAMTKRWTDARTQLQSQYNEQFYIGLKVHAGFASDQPQPDAWHQYAPAVRTDAQSSYYMVSPGFWKNGDPVRLARDPGSFTSSVIAMTASPANWKFTETWNEWGEGSSVEPGEEVIQTTGGAAKPNPNGALFHNAYVDILNKNLPPLEHGTGVNSTPSPSAKPACTLHTLGDADCNNTIDIADFEIFRKEFTGVVATRNADFDSDGTVSIIDFEIWRRGFYDTAQATAIPTLAPQSTVLAAVGDIACGAEDIGKYPCKQKETSDLAISMSPDAVLVLGDTQYESGQYSNFMTYYDPTWGRLKNKTYPVIGNHEYGTPQAKGYFDYFNGVGQVTGKAGDRSKGYYSFNLGSWHVVVLNSNCAEAGGCNAGSTQETWLRADLASHPALCTLAAWHHPRYSSGFEGSPSTYDDFWKSLIDHHVDLVLVGHSHDYERFEPINGISEIVVGTGGRDFTGWQPTIAPHSVVRNNTNFGVLKLTLNPTGYDWQFMPISGSFSDKGSAVCH